MPIYGYGYKYNRKLMLTNTMWTFLNTGMQSLYKATDSNFHRSVCGENQGNASKLVLRTHCPQNSLPGSQILARDDQVAATSHTTVAVSGILRSKLTCGSPGNSFPVSCSLVWLPLDCQAMSSEAILLGRSARGCSLLHSISSTQFNAYMLSEISRL